MDKLELKEITDMICSSQIVRIAEWLKRNCTAFECDFKYSNLKSVFKVFGFIHLFTYVVDLGLNFFLRAPNSDMMYQYSLSASKK